MTPDLVTVEVRNSRDVRNHIGQVHAAAMMMLGETASGLVTGMNISDSSLPLIKEMKTQFIKRSTGKLTATAKINLQQRILFHQQDKGEIVIPVEVRDEKGEIPVLIEAIWAWIPKSSEV
jgi:acyl-coenzyme A thioesterase PaaI-like protein